MLMGNAGFLGALVITGALATGCASKELKGVADVPECRAAADGVTKQPFDVGADHLRHQADAYSDCMTARGYVLDEVALQSNLDRYEMVQNAQVMLGDPAPLLAVRRQKLRMNPALWRSATPPAS
jgi:hypothetical protein